MSTESTSLDNTATVHQQTPTPKVAPKNATWHWGWWLGVGGILLILFWSIQGRHHQAIAKAPQQVTPTDFHKELSANLAALKTMKSQLAQLKTTLPHTATPSTIPAPPHWVGPTTLTDADSTLFEASTSDPSNTQEGTVNATLAGHDGNSQFANQRSQPISATAVKVSHPDYTVVAGEFLPAVLETAIQSDLPGMVRAIVSRPVYSYVGERLLIPYGSRLIGQYASSVLQGQNRVMIVWNRVVLPDGTSVQIDSPGTDTLGRAGQGADTINRHFFARFGNAALLSLISAGAANVGVSSGDEYNASQAYRSAVSQSFANAASDSLDGQRRIPITLNIHQGAKINVFVSKDLSFYHVYHPLDESTQ